MPEFFCVECSAHIGTEKPVPEGRKIKCPKCAAVFDPLDVVQPSGPIADDGRATKVPSFAPVADAVPRRKPVPTGIVALQVAVTTIAFLGVCVSSAVGFIWKKQAAEVGVLLAQLNDQGGPFLEFLEIMSPDAKPAFKEMDQQITNSATAANLLFVSMGLALLASMLIWRRRGILAGLLLLIAFGAPIYFVPKAAFFTGAFLLAGLLCFLVRRGRSTPDLATQGNPA